MSRLTKTLRKTRPATDAEALAKMLPEHLMSFGLTTDIDRRALEISAWVRSVKVTPSPELVAGIITASGLGLMAGYRDRMTRRADGTCRRYFNKG